VKLEYFSRYQLLLYVLWAQLLRAGHGFCRTIFIFVIIAICVRVKKACDWGHSLIVPNWIQVRQDRFLFFDSVFLNRMK